MGVPKSNRHQFGAPNEEDVGMLQGTHNLQVLRGLSSNRSLLSCTADGAVNLWITDDGSGRQKWNFTYVQGSQEQFNIIVSGGTNPGKMYLSCNDDGTVVDLWSTDDGSGRQRWRLVPIGGSQICNYFNIIVIGGVNSRRDYLSCTPDGSVDLWSSDDGSGRQRWQVQ
jgi:outer membrane protein assembly factor BamB